MKTIILKNGEEEVESLVTITMMSLENLVQTNPIVAYELVEVCKNSTHKPFGNTTEILEKLGLMTKRMHSSVC